MLCRGSHKEMKLALILPSKYQHILDDCYKTLLPSIRDKDAHIFMVSMTANSPKHPQITDIRSTEYAPNKYFNEIVGTLSCDYVGIINDDIVFNRDWLDDILKNLEIYDCVSPGYVQSPNADRFIQEVERTKNEVGINNRFFGSCYIFKVSVFGKIGYFDENVVGGYDIDWWWRMKKAGLSCVTLKKVSILHYGALTNGSDDEAVDYRFRNKQFKGEFVKKFGGEDWGEMVRAMRGVRKEYVFE